MLVGAELPMVDIHCHIIPAVDDGVRSIGEAIELIGKEVEGGTHRFIATPHVYDERDVYGTEALADKVQDLRSSVLEAGITVEILQGAEVFPMRGALTGLDKGFPLTSGNYKKHMLVDLPMSAFPVDLDDILFEIQSRGVTPILAHPERTGPFQRDPDSLQSYLDRGIACQVNAGSLYGRYGARATECANYFLSRHWPHFLASDAHRPRPEPMLKRALELVGYLDAAYRDILVEQSGMAISEGLPLPKIPPAPPISPKKKRFFGLFG